MKDKRIALIFLLVGIFVVTLITVFCVMEKFEHKKLRRNYDTYYSMYVDIESKVKITFKDDLVVTRFEMLVDDVIYSDIEAKDMNLIDVIVELSSRAYLNDVDISDIQLRTDYKDLDVEKIENAIHKSVEKEVEISIQVLPIE